MPIVNHQVYAGLTGWDHYRLGRLYRIPWCCIARWVYGHKRRNRIQAALRGAVTNPVTHGHYVPCGIFHRSK